MYNRIVFLVWIAVVTVSAATDVRLPKDITPKRYHLILVTPAMPADDFETVFKFSGRLEVDVVVIKSTSVIRLHARDLTIDENSVEVSDGHGEGAFTIAQQAYLSADIYQITLTKPLDVGQYIITMEYEGTFSKTVPLGFYASHGMDESVFSGKWVAATQFSSVGARRAFPCFDEPEFKASFDVEITHHKDFVALTNMPRISSTKTRSEEVRDVFATSLPMSTYVVAFVLTPYQVLSNKNGNHSIWTPKMFADFIPDSLATAELALQEMVVFTEQPFQLPKLDHMSVPVFAAGAMENWGLILYKRSNLVYMPKYETTAKRQKTAQVIAHEISHQWFGDQVTPLWWDYIWLNEGFATFFEYYIFPDWRMWDQFVPNIQQDIMDVDSRGIHGVEITVKDPNEWSADDIAYKKAASIIRMLENTLTPNIFRSGLQHYLIESNLSSVTAQKLWDSLQKAVDESKPLLGIFKEYTVSEFAAEWISAPGYPVVTVLTSIKEKSITLTQEKFVWAEVTEKPSKWVIPINVVSKEGQHFENATMTFWLADKPLVIPYPEVSHSWIIINAEQRGYFRVNYDIINWVRLTDLLQSKQFTTIPPATRAQLVDDAMQLAATGRLPYSTALQLSTYLAQESDLVPWQAALRNFDFLQTHMLSPELWASYTKYMKELFSVVYTSVGGVTQTLSKPDHFRNLTWSTVVPRACLFDIADCGSDAHQIFQDIKQNVSISPDLQAAVYCGAIRHDTNNWDWLFGFLTTINRYLERDRVIQGLACATNSDNLRMLLGWALSKEGFPPEALSIFKAVLANGQPGLNEALWAIENSFADITSKDEEAFISIINEVAKRLALPEQHERFQTFVNKQKEDRQKRLKDASKRVEENVVWHREHIDDLTLWFQKYFPAPTTTPPPTNPPSTTPNDEDTSTTGEPGGAAHQTLSAGLMVYALQICLMILGFV